MQCSCIEHAVRLKRPDMLIEHMLAVGVYECPQLQPDEFFACVAVHQVCRRIRLDYETRFQINNDQPVVGGIENAAILPFSFFRGWLVRAFVHSGYLWLSSIA